MMKKFVSIVTASAVLASLAVKVSAEDNSLGNLLVLGDSITSGYGLDGYVSGDNSSASGSFANMLAASDLFDGGNYDNFAVDGRTSEELLEAVSTDETFRDKISDADEIVISIGGNDFLRPMITAMQTAMMSDQEFMQSIMDGTASMEDMASAMFDKYSETILSAVENIDLDQSSENISNIFESIYGLNQDCDVYILTIYDPFDVDGEGAEMLADFKEVSEKNLTYFNDGIRTAADEYENVHVIDVNEAFKDHAVDYTNIASGDVHPNKDGHKVIYDLLYEAMSESVPAAAEAAFAEEDMNDLVAYEQTGYAAAEDVASPDETSPSSEQSAPAASEETPALVPLDGEPTSAEQAPAPEVNAPSAPASDSSPANAPTGNVPAGTFAAVSLISLAAIAASKKKKN